MKKICFITLMVISTIMGKSQNYFETLIQSEDGINREGKFAVETRDHGYIISCDAQYIFQNDMLVKLSPEGDLTNRLLFQIDDKNIKYCGLFHHPNNDNEYLAVTALAAGSGFSDFLQHEIALIIFDNELNVLSQTIIDFGDEYTQLATGNKDMPRFILEDNGTITMAAHCRKTESSCYLFAKFTLDGQILGMVESDFLSATSNYLFNAFSKRRSDGSFGMVLYDNRGGEAYYEVDSLFNITRVGKLSDRAIKVVPAPQGTIPDSTYYYIGVQGTVEYLNDSVFLASSSGMFLRHVGGITGYCHFLAMFSDSLDVADIGVWDIYKDEPNYKKKTLPARDKAIGVTDDAIFHCGVLGLKDHGHYSTGSIAPSTLTISKFDRELNLIWRRYINKNENFYDINVIQATEDGGCIINGIFSKSESYYNFYSYVHKFDADGYDSVDEAESIARPYLCYPNPAKDNLYIELSPDVKCQSVEIYDIDGRLVETFPETSPQTTIDISGLHAGMYIVKLRMANGKEYEEKIVKK